MARMAKRVEQPLGLMDQLLGCDLYVSKPEDRPKIWHVTAQPELRTCGTAPLIGRIDRAEFWFRCGECGETVKVGRAALEAVDPRDAVDEEGMPLYLPEAREFEAPVAAARVELAREIYHHEVEDGWGLAAKFYDPHFAGQLLTREEARSRAYAYMSDKGYRVVAEKGVHEVTDEEYLDLTSHLMIKRKGEGVDWPAIHQALAVAILSQAKTEAAA